MPVLYLSYNGLMEQLGQSQVFPYLKSLAVGRHIVLMTFEKPRDLADSERYARFRKVTRDAGIRWIPLRYHKRPIALATAYDLIVGFVVGAFQCLTRRITVVHARGHVMALLGLAIKRCFRPRFIFDVRGFYLDQRVEMGLSRENSRGFRIARWLETRALRAADVIVALSRPAVDVMKTWPALAGRNVRFEVVPTCTDLERFTPDAGTGPQRPLTIGYAGNAGQGYDFEPVLDVYEAIRAIRPDARLRIINRNDRAFIRSCLATRGLTNGNVELLSADYAEMPAQLRQIDIGVFFYRWRKSHVSSVPTRMGEFLACGVICVSNTSGAFVREILEGEGLGVVLPDFQPDSLRRAAIEAVQLAVRPDIRARCADAAKRYFSLEEGVATYARVYADLERRVV